MSSLSDGCEPQSDANADAASAHAHACLRSRCSGVELDMAWGPTSAAHRSGENERRRRQQRRATRSGGDGRRVSDRDRSTGNYEWRERGERERGSEVAKRSEGRQRKESDDGKGRESEWREATKRHAAGWQCDRHDEDRRNSGQPDKCGGKTTGAVGSERGGEGQPASLRQSLLHPLKRQTLALDWLVMVESNPPRRDQTREGWKNGAGWCCVRRGRLHTRERSDESPLRLGRARCCSRLALVLLTLRFGLRRRRRGGEGCDRGGGGGGRGGELLDEWIHGGESDTHRQARVSAVKIRSNSSRLSTVAESRGKAERRRVRRRRRPCRCESSDDCRSSLSMYSSSSDCESVPDAKQRNVSI